MVDAPDAELARLQILDTYSILDTEAEQQFDDLVEIASALCGVSSALVSFVARDRQWAKAICGFALQEIPRDMSFCSHSVMSRELLLVEDATKDPRFQDNALVTQAPHIRFYAGAPIIEKHGHVLGSVCVLDNQPHTLTEQQQQALKALARRAADLLEYRSIVVEREEIAAEMRFAHWLAARAKSHLELASDTRDLALWSYEPEGNIFEGDRRAQNLLGLSRPRVGLDELLAVLAEEEQARLPQAFATALCGSRFSLQMKLGARNGHLPVYARARCVTDLQGRSSLIGVLERVAVAGLP